MERIFKNKAVIVTFCLMLSVCFCALIFTQISPSTAEASVTVPTYNPTPHYTVLDGADGGNNENYGNLFDGSTSTKYCIKIENNPYVVVKSSSYGTIITGYKLSTANDTAGHSGRNPKDWVLYGSNDYNETSKSGTWTAIQTITNDTTLGATNFTAYTFNVSNASPYKYFKFAFTARRGSEDDDMGTWVDTNFQLSEIEIISSVMTISQDYLREHSSPDFEGMVSELSPAYDGDYDTYIGDEICTLSLNITPDMSGVVLYGVAFHLYEVLASAEDTLTYFTRQWIYYRENVVGQGFTKFTTKQSATISADGKVYTVYVDNSSPHYNYKIHNNTAPYEANIKIAEVEFLYHFACEHSFTGDYVAITEAQCNAEGNRKYRTCAYGCGAAEYYDDSDTLQTCEIHDFQDKVIIPCLPHSGTWTNATTAECCYQGNYQYCECSFCGVYEYIVDGKTYTCRLAEKPTKIIIPPTGEHDWSTTEIIPQEDATCTEAGTKAHWHCNTSGRNYDSDKTTWLRDLSIPATGHSYGNWTAPVAPTCTAYGNYAYRQCSTSTCGSYQYITDLSITDYDAYVNANGETIGTCAQADYNTYIRRDKIAHTWSTTEIIPQVDATCTETGTKAYWHCSECGGNYDSDKSTRLTDLTINALGHSYGAWTDALPQTCTADGNYKYSKCSTCNGYKYEKEGATLTCTSSQFDSLIKIPASHTYGTWTNALSPTCTTAGNYRYCQCSVCNNYKYEKDGNEYTCSSSDFDNEIKLDATGHSYGNWVNAVDSGCTSLGNLKYRQCTTTGCKIYEYVNATGQTHTCAENEYDTYIRILPSHDYDYDNWTSDDTYHWHACKREGCTAREGTRPHDYFADCVATCGSCGYVRSESELVHTKDTYAWIYDNTHHWHRCTASIAQEGEQFITCSAQLDKASHTYEDGRYYELNGKHYKKCVTCDYYDPSTETSCDYEMKYDDYHHYNECKVCHTYSSIIDHVFSSDCDATCNTEGCNYVRTTYIDHATSSWYTDATNHWKVCSRCNSQYSKEAHDLTDNCDDDSHFLNCEACGYRTQVESHSYDDNEDPVCNECNYIRTVYVNSLSFAYSGYVLNGSVFDFSTTISANANKVVWSEDYDDNWGIVIGSEEEMETGEYYWVESVYYDGYSYFMPNTDYWIYIYIESAKNEAGRSLYSLEHLNTNNITLQGIGSPRYVFDRSGDGIMIFFKLPKLEGTSNIQQMPAIELTMSGYTEGSSVQNLQFTIKEGTSTFDSLDIYYNIYVNNNEPASGATFNTTDFYSVDFYIYNKENYTFLGYDTNDFTVETLGQPFELNISETGGYIEAYYRLPSLMGEHECDFQWKNTLEEIHYKECTLCYAIQEGTEESHVFDNAFDRTCETCGYTRTVNIPYLSLNLTGYALDEPTGDMALTLDSEISGINSSLFRFILTTDIYSYETPYNCPINNTFIWGDGYFMPNTEYWVIVYAYATDGYCIDNLQAENVYINDNYCTASLCYYNNQRSNIIIKLPVLEGESTISTVPEIGELSISGYSAGGSAGDINVTASQTPTGIKPTNESSGLLAESRLFFKDSYTMTRMLEQLFIANGSYGDLLPENIISAKEDYYLAVLMLPDTGYTFYGFDKEDISIAGFGNPIDILLGNGGEYALMLFNAPALTVATHEHSYSSNYSCNATHHWKNCEACSEKSEYAVHEFDDDNPLQCTICNQVITRVISLDLEFSGYEAGNYVTDLVLTSNDNLYANFRGYGALYRLFDNKIDIIDRGLSINYLSGRHSLDSHTNYYLMYTLYPVNNLIELSLSPENITLGDYGNPFAIVTDSSDPTDVCYYIYFELPTIHTHTQGLYYNEEVGGVHYHYVKCDECDYYYQDTKTACDANGLFAGDITHSTCCSICKSTNGSVGVAHTFNIANHDDNNHWNECICGKVDSSTLVAHNYNQIKNDENNHWNECSCGKVDSSSITAHGWNANHDDSQHWQECTCGKIKDAVNHSFANGSITCSDCSFSLTVVDSMSFTVGGYELDGNMRDFDVTLSSSTVGVSSTFNAYITIKYEKAVENVEYIILADNEYAYFLPGVQYWAWIVVNTASAKYTFKGMTKDDITVNGAQVVDCYTDSNDTTAYIGVRLPDIGGNSSIEDVSAMNFTMTGYAEGANCSGVSVTIPSNANVIINAVAVLGNDTTFDKTKQYHIGVEIFAKENYTLLNFDMSMATINESIPCVGIEGIGSHGSCILFFKLPSLYEEHEHVTVDTWLPTVDGSKHFSYCSLCSEETDPTDHVYSEDSPYVCTLCGHENYTQVSNFSFTLSGYEVDALIKDTTIAISDGYEGFTIPSGNYYQGFTIMNRTSNKDYSSWNTYSENTASFFMPGILYTVKVVLTISEGYICNNINLDNITLNGTSASNGGYYNNSQSTIIVFFDLPIITTQSEKTTIEPEFEIQGYTIGGAYNAFDVTTSYAGIDSTNLDIQLVKHMGGDLDMEASTLFESYDAFKLELTIRPIAGYTIVGMDENSITFTDPSKILRFERYYYNDLYESVTYVWHLKHLNPEHTHTYTLSYWDDTNHWMECPSCHAPNTPEPHTFTEDNPYECTGCSYTRKYSVTEVNITLDGFTIGSKYGDIQVSDAMVSASVTAMSTIESYFAISQDVLEEDFSSVIQNTTNYRFLDSTINYYFVILLRYNPNLDFSQFTMNGITLNSTIVPSLFNADYLNYGEYCLAIFNLGKLAVNHIHGGDWVNAIPVTCESDGLLGHYECTICGKFFDGEDNELTSTVVSALGHNWDLRFCDTSGVEGNCHDYYCTNCNSWQGNSAECTISDEWKNDADYHWHECSVCKHKFDYDEHNHTILCDGDSHWEECTVCGKGFTAKSNHSFVSETTTTCSFEGCPYQRYFNVEIDVNGYGVDQLLTGLSGSATNTTNNTSMSFIGSEIYDENHVRIPTSSSLGEADFTAVFKPETRYFVKLCFNSGSYFPADGLAAESFTLPSGYSFIEYEYDIIKGESGSLYVKFAIVLYTPEIGGISSMEHVPDMTLTLDGYSVGNTLGDITLSTNVSGASVGALSFSDNGTALATSTVIANNKYFTLTLSITAPQGYDFVGYTIDKLSVANGAGEIMSITVSDSGSSLKVVLDLRGVIAEHECVFDLLINPNDDVLTNPDADNKHRKVCSICGEYSYEDHAFDDNLDRSCNICGYYRSVVLERLDINLTNYVVDGIVGNVRASIAENDYNIAVYGSYNNDYGIFDSNHNRYNGRNSRFLPNEQYYLKVTVTVAVIIDLKNVENKNVYVNGTLVSVLSSEKEQGSTQEKITYKLALPILSGTTTQQKATDIDFTISGLAIGGTVGDVSLGDLEHSAVYGYDFEIYKKGEDSALASSFVFVSDYKYILKVRVKLNEYYYAKGMSDGDITVGELTRVGDIVYYDERFGTTGVGTLVFYDFQIKFDLGEDHVHSFTGENIAYDSNASGHAPICECGTIGERVAHTCSTENPMLCSVCGAVVPPEKIEFTLTSYIIGMSTNIRDNEYEILYDTSWLYMSVGNFTDNYDIEELAFNVGLGVVLPDRNYALVIIVSTIIDITDLTADDIVLNIGDNEITASVWETMVYNNYAYMAGCVFEIPAIQVPHIHGGVWVDGDPASCTETGVKGYYDCTICGKHFDENNVEITDLIIPALGHDCGEWIPEVPANCINTGTKAHKTCSVCNLHFDNNGNVIESLTIPVDENNHSNISFVAKVDEGCTTDGVKAYYKCDGCGDRFEDAEGLNEISNFDTWKVIPAYHKFGEWQLEVPANCINTGTKAHKTCSVCNLHFDNNGNVIESLTIPVDENNHSNISFVAKVDEGCTTNGVKAYYKCDGCGAKFEDAEGLNEISDFDTWKVIPASHKFGEWQLEVPATCINTGIKAHKTCTACNLHFDNEGNQITSLTLDSNPDNHEGSLMDGWQKDSTYHWKEYSCCHAQIEKVAHTPNRDEATESDPVKCTECQYIIEPTKEHVHVLSFVAKVDEGCTTNGVKAHYACSGCSDKFEDAEGTKLISNFDTWKDIPASHKFGEWITEVPSTCCNTGSKAHFTCSVCNKNFDANGEELDITIAIDDSKHTTISFVKKVDAGCTTDGVKAHYKCDGCDAKFEDEQGTKIISDFDTWKVIPASHKFGEWVVEVPSSCCNNGVKAHKTCTACNLHFDDEGNVIESLTLPLDGDNHTNISFVAKVDEGCTTNGVKAYYECDGCDVKFEDEEGVNVISNFDTWKVIPASHKFGEWIPEVPSTCCDTGVKGYKTCSVCHNNFDNNGDLIANLAIDVNPDNHEGSLMTDLQSNATHHWKEYSCCHAQIENVAHTPNRDEATESDPIKCTECDYIITPAKGHTHVLTLIGKVDEGCTTNGTKAYYSCSGCSDKFEDAEGTKLISDFDTWKVIPPSHNLGEWVAEVPATCCNPGVAGHKTCSACNLNFDDNGVKLATLVIPVDNNNHEGSLSDTLLFDATHHWKEYSCCHAVAENVEHSFGDLSVEVPATCCNTGVIAHKACSICNVKVGSDGKIIKDITIPINGNNHTNISFVAKVDEGCTTNGVKAHYKCDGCDVKFEDENGTIVIVDFATWSIIPASHKLGEWITEVPSTCCNTGSKAHFTCFVCNKNFDANGEELDITIAIDGSKHTTISFVKKVDPSCVTDGVKAHYKCDGCDVKFEDENGTIVIADFATWSVIPASHKLGEWVAEVPATCISNGTKGHYTCTVCNKNFDNEGVEITDLTIAINGNHTLLQLFEEVKATTTSEGNIAYYRCNGCNKYFSDEQGKKEITAQSVIIPKLPEIIDHDNKWEKGDSEKGLSFKIRSDFARFIAIYVDGEEVDTGNYEIDENESKICLKSSFLNAVSSGEHEIKVSFSNGDVKTTFFVEEKEDDSLSAGAWVGIGIAIAVVVAVIVLVVILGIKGKLKGVLLTIKEFFKKAIQKIKNLFNDKKNKQALEPSEETNGEESSDDEEKISDSNTEKE